MKYILIFILTSILLACEKDPELTGPTGNDSEIIFKFSHHIDSANLTFNTFLYKNAANNIYQISNIEYYVSKIIFHRTDGVTYDANVYHYINPEKINTLVFKMQNIPSGEYDRISMILGIDSARNVKDGLDNNEVNASMEWPDVQPNLRGGYHFMRFEGLYKDTVANKSFGYLIHLGNSPNQAKLDFSVPKFAVGYRSTHIYEMNMNLNNRFKSPNLIDLYDDYGSIMEDNEAQQKFKQNAIQVFDLKPL